MPPQHTRSAGNEGAGSGGSAFASGGWFCSNQNMGRSGSRKGRCGNDVIGVKKEKTGSPDAIIRARRS